MRAVEAPDPDIIEATPADDVVFRSPVTFKPYWINAFLHHRRDGWDASQGRHLRGVEIMNSRIIGRLAVAAAVAAAIVVSDPGGAGNVAAPTGVADGAAGAGSHAIVIGDPGGDGPGPKVVTPSDPGARPE